VKRTNKRIACAAAVALSWLVGIGTANAIIVRGFVDPLFGGSGVENGMYWTAEIEFQDADNSCVASDGTNITCTPDAGSLSITGTLQQQVPGPFGPVVPVDFLFSAADPVIKLNVSGGVITGIQTGIIGPTDFTTVSGPDIQGFAWVDFEFGSGDSPSVANLLFQICPPVTVPDTRSFSFSRYNDCTPSADCTPNSELADTSTTATVRIEQIPEPGMLWLVVAAMSAGWLARRRVLHR